MEKSLLLSNLYDYYGCLLTEKQQNYFESYHFHDLTLSEISKNHDVSRNAIHNLLKDAEEKLVEYENKLHLFENSTKIKEIILNLDETIRERIEKLI